MFAYAPAETSSAGYAVVTERFVGLFSADASAEVISTVHRMLDGPGSTPEPALELLSNPTSAERFALVEIVDADNRIFGVTMRGDIVVDLGGASTSRFTWPRGQNWLHGEAYGVESLHLSMEPVASAVSGLPLRNGAVRASAISVGVDLAINAPLTSGESELPLETVALSDLERDAAYEEAIESTMSRKASDIEAPAPIDTGTIWTLTLPDGNELVAAPQIVVGRKPWRSSPDETQTYYIVAPSPHREISSKHVEFIASGGELRARDLDSTNGTLVLTPDRPPRLLRGGDSVSLQRGDTLDLGEGFRIVVGSRS